jgi:hypothetical protein
VPRPPGQSPLTALLVATALLASGGIAAGAPAPDVGPAALKHCGRIVNPYEGTRYEGVDLRGIRADGVTCARARRVTRRAHDKALRITPPPSGVRHFMWHGWSVIGDIRPETDRYLATRGAKRVRWVF